MKDEKVYLKHIMLSIETIERYIKGVTKSRFLMESMISDAVIRQIEIIGEAAKHVSEDTKKKSSQIPWKDITGMRDKLIHAYFGVDKEAVWDTAKRDISALKGQIKKLMGD